jgi:hypothetical protein
MYWLYILIVIADCLTLRVSQCFLQLGSEFIETHLLLLYDELSLQFGTAMLISSILNDTACLIFRQIKFKIYALNYALFAPYHAFPAVLSDRAIGG